MNNTITEPVYAKQVPKSIWNKSFIILFFANMAFNLGLNMSNSLLAIYADYLGAPASVIGLVVSSFGVSAILFRLISAPVMDTYNRKYLVVFAALMLAIAFGGFSISHSIPMVIGFRLIQGCGMAFGNACCLVMVADMLPKDKYNSGLGYFSLAQVVSSAAGPSVGLALVDMAGFRATYTLTACLMLFAAFLALQLKTNFKRTKKLKLALNNIIAKEAILPVGVNFIMVLGGAGVYSFLFIFAREQGVTGNIGLYYTVSALILLITRPVLGKLTDRYGIIKIAVPAVCFSIISMFIVSYSATLAGFLIAAAISALGQGAMGPAIQALTMKTVPSERRGAASSTNYISLDLGSMLGPIIAGQVAQIFGYTMMWRIMVIPYIVATAVLVCNKKTIVRIEEDFAAS